MKQPDKKYNDEDNMLVNDLRSIVSKARSKAFAAVNYSLVERNWRIGQRIVEQEQNGASRAEYGKHVIEVASAALTEEFGKGFSYTNIANYKRFYLTFNNLQILQTVSEEFNNPIQQTLPAKSSALHKEDKAESTQSELRLLPWSHYERLIRVEDKKAREWYAKEAPLQKGQALPDLFQSHFPYNYPFIYKIITFSCIKFAIPDIYTYLCNEVTELPHVVQERAEGSKAPSPGQRPGYISSQQGAL